MLGGHGVRLDPERVARHQEQYSRDGEYSVYGTNG